jgi:4-amino-4-deoxy-L-arabinose transferase-like glycosyltransferase
VRVFGPRAALACYLMLLLAYLAGAAVPLMDAGSAKYATIALHISETGDWTRLVTDGKNFLDKPHLLFWLSAISFEMFGVTTAAYKLPSLLFSMLAVYATIRLGTLLRNETTGRLAGVILASAFAFVLANNDVRVDALLIGSTIFTTWQLLVFVNDDNKLTRRTHLVVAGAGLALGLASKGMIGVALPLVAVCGSLVYCLQWRRLFDPSWLALPFIALLFASPVLYAYHVQFGMEGVRHILWTQTERVITAYAAGGENERPFFYYTTWLWAFLPWTVMALWSLVSGMRRFTSDRYWPRARSDALSLGVIVSAFILFSFSRARLPHYIGVLLPFFAIQLAGWLLPRLRHPRSLHRLWQVQYVVFAVVLEVAGVLNGWMFPLQDPVIGLIVAALFVLGVWFIPRWTGGSRLVIVSVSVSSIFWLLANLNFYPQLLDNQAGTELGRFAIASNYPPESLFYLEGDRRSASFDFTTRRFTPTISYEELIRRDKPVVLFVTSRGRDLLESKGLSCSMLSSTSGNDPGGMRCGMLRSSSDYRVSHLRWNFLNPHTRDTVKGAAELLQVQPR